MNASRTVDGLNVLGSKCSMNSPEKLGVSETIPAGDGTHRFAELLANALITSNPEMIACATRKLYS